jgi:pSer/pThr/pTyr-binding forkhead associated (FHA) protein
MRRAFESGTIAEEMWGLLQSNCLRRRMEEQEARPRRMTRLGRRLKGEAEAAEAAPAVEEVTPPPAPVARAPVREPIRTPQPAREPIRTPMPAREPIRTPTPTREPVRAPTPIYPKKVEEERKEPVSPRYCLALPEGRYRIALPVRGEIVIGRFDPRTGVSPDVDLSYDDRINRVISRRHARILGHDGWHEIEDLGSTNGTRVNGKRLNIGQKMRLRPGDRVALGYNEFAYVPMPKIRVVPYATPPRAHLRVAFTGRRFSLPAQGEVIVGRGDQTVGYVPEIDLGKEGGAAQVVARRHIKIIARDSRHYVEDLGSANGTKINGVRVEISEIGPLNPGDHLWLGGCVLAYDVEI